MDSARTVPPPRHHPHPPPPPPTHQYSHPQSYAQHLVTAPIAVQLPAAGPGSNPSQPPTAHISTNLPNPISHSTVNPSVDPRSQQYQPQSAPPAHPNSVYAPSTQSPIAHGQPYPLPPPPTQYNASLPPINTSQPQQSPVGHPHSAPPHVQSYTQESGSGATSVGGYRQPSGSSEGEAQYQHHNRSGHGTPALVTHRSLPHDPTGQQRPPSTPAQAGPGAAAGPAAEPLTGPRPMEPVMYQQHATTSGAHHAPMPPPYHPGPPVDPQQLPYVSTPVVDHHGYGPPPPQGYHPQGYPPGSVPHMGNAAAQAKRRPTRAQQACDQCRQRKQKCDEGMPCSFCKEQNIDCKYRDTPVAKSDKNGEKVVEGIDKLTKLVEQLREDISSMKDRVLKLEDSDDVKSLHNEGAPIQQQATPAPSDKLEEVRGRRQHRTGPHNLVHLWPSIKPLFTGCVYPKPSYVMEAENRGMLRIYGRGEGIDEQDGTQHTADSPSHSESGSSPSDLPPAPPEGLWGRGFNNNTSASSARPLGTAGGLKLDGSLDIDFATVMSLYESYIKHMHCMHPFIDKARSRRMIDTFVSRYSPDGRQKHTTSWAVPSTNGSISSNGEFDRPLKRQRTNDSPSMPSHSIPVPSQAPAPVENVKNPLVTERSPTNAIVWLILALGKICLHDKPLPALPDGRQAINQDIMHTLTGNPGMHGGSPMSYVSRNGSPRFTPATHPTPSEQTGYKTDPTRSPSNDSTSGVVAKNLDVVPGLAYFAKAAEILGDHGAGADLVHAQMFLLAALYTGQLARVRESMTWLSRAGQVCISLIDRLDLYKPTELLVPHSGARTEKMVELYHQAVQVKFNNKRNRLTIIASWSALQMESDILAELKFPSSGIQQIEKGILLPMYNASEGSDEQYDEVRTNDSRQKQEVDDEHRIMLYYSSQLFLRRRLNDLHAELHGYQLTGSTKDIGQKINEYEFTLEQWRTLLPDRIAWQDNDPPPADILAARLRAKYYGAVYVSTRPILDYVLHIMGRVRAGESVEDVAVDVEGRPRDQAEINVFKAIASKSDEEIWEGAKRCIRAALKSTVALDGVPSRLIVTNIHGTAHAQFGNMLVLSAVYNATLKDEFIQTYADDLIDKDEFRQKLTRTIGFLRKLAPLSPTLSIDAGYLEHIEKGLFPVAEDAEDVKDVYAGEREPSSVNNSFSR